jgi:hypothetical protein
MQQRLDDDHGSTNQRDCSVPYSHIGYKSLLEDGARVVDARCDRRAPHDVDAGPVETEISRRTPSVRLLDTVVTPRGCRGVVSIA